MSKEAVIVLTGKQIKAIADINDGSNTSLISIGFVYEVKDDQNNVTKDVLCAWFTEEPEDGVFVLEG